MSGDNDGSGDGPRSQAADLLSATYRAHLCALRARNDAIAALVENLERQIEAVEALMAERESDAGTFMRAVMEMVQAAASPGSDLLPPPNRPQR